MRSAIVLAAGVLLGCGLCLLVPQAAPIVASAQGTPSGNGDVNGSGAIDIADAIFLLSYLFAHGPTPEEILECPACDSCCPSSSQMRLPATGQTRCYNAVGSQIDCADPGFPGQEMFHQPGCPTAGRFVNNDDGTVTDNCTGLMWQRATAPGTHTWANALKYCDSLELAGHDDWRLPNIRELESIVDRGRGNPAIDPAFQSSAAANSWYWSSTTYVAGPSYAWLIGFIAGVVDGDVKNSTLNVRAVRSVH